MKIYKEAREYIQTTMSLGSVLGLENIQELLRRMNNPQNQLKFVHVAGTNGKGSIVSYIAEVLNEAGYRTGKYISPTVLGYRERIQVNDLWITEEAFTDGIKIIKEKIDEMIAAGFSHPTAFEIETALAFWYFKEMECDIVILETGLGGKQDATNIISEALCYVFASISMDHTDYLGNTLDKIAHNKAGIIKHGGAVITGKQPPVVLEILKKTAVENECKFVLADVKNVSEVEQSQDGQKFVYKMGNDEKILIQSPLLGTYQIQNVVTAMEVIQVLQNEKYIITKENIYNGILKTKWFGRFTKVNEQPLFFVDGAHNKDAAKNLRETLVTYFPDKRFIYIIGVFQDKDYSGILAETVDLAEKIYTVTAPGPRGVAAAGLKKIIANYHDNVEETKSVEEAVEKSCANGQDKIIIAFGSLSYLGDIYYYFQNKLFS